MDHQRVQQRVRLSRLALAALVTLTIALLLAFTWFDFSWKQSAAAARDRDVRIKELQGEIVHLDEVLTMSAMMAATTGDEKWEARYRRYEPILGAAIEEALRITPPDLIAATAQTDEANVQLVEMENRSFELVRQGKSKQAQGVLFGERYARQKQIYAAGMQSLDASLDAFVESANAEMTRGGQIRLMAMGSAIAMAIVGWIAVVSAMRRSEKALVGSHRQLSMQADELAELNDELEERAAQLANANDELEQSNEQLVDEIDSRIVAEKKQRELHQKLLETTRQAGMAEIATGVLHNVGNALNSVNVAANLALDKVRESRATDLGRAVGLMQQHAGDLSGFIASDERGRFLLPFLAHLNDQLSEEKNLLLELLHGLGEKVNHINQIVKSQQSYAKVSGVAIQFDVRETVVDALATFGDTLARHQVRVERHFDDVPVVTADKHKLMQILINLIANAVHALIDSSVEGPRLVVRVTPRGDDAIVVEVEDNGVGIAADHLTKIFQFGFTTKKTGHGFGLHHSALAARELGGDLRADSAGPGAGACFTLEMPAMQPAKSRRREEATV